MGCKYGYTIENFSRINNGVSVHHNAHKGLLKSLSLNLPARHLSRCAISYGRTIQTLYMFPRYYTLFTNANNYVQRLFNGSGYPPRYVTYHVYSQGNGILVYRSVYDHKLKAQMCRQ